MTRVAQERSLLSDLLTPNEETVASIKSVRAGQVKSFADVTELLDYLHADD